MKKIILLFVAALFIQFIGLQDATAIADNPIAGYNDTAATFSEDYREMQQRQLEDEQFSGAEVGAILLFVFIALLYLITQDLKKTAKRRALKLFLNLFATVLAVPAPWVSAIYVVIRFLILIVGALVKMSSRR